MKLSDTLVKLGRPIAYYPGLRELTGSTNATIFLCQFVYWTGKESSGDGWIYKTADQIQEETGLSYYEQKNARQKLIEAGFLSEKYARLEHQMYFKINLDTLNARWRTAEPSVPECDNPSFPNEGFHHSLIGTTEITTEITTDIKHTHKTAPDIDFINLTVSQAAALPELRTFRETTGRIPSHGQYETVCATIRAMNGKGNAKYLRPFWLEWSNRGYNASGLAWLTVWAESGEIPKRTNKNWKDKPALPASETIGEKNNRAVKRVVKEMIESKQLKVMASSDKKRFLLDRIEK